MSNQQAKLFEDENRRNVLTEATRAFFEAVGITASDAAIIKGKSLAQFGELNFIPEITSADGKIHLTHVAGGQDLPYSSPLAQLAASLQTFLYNAIDNDPQNASTYLVHASSVLSRPPAPPLTKDAKEHLSNALTAFGDVVLEGLGFNREATELNGKWARYVSANHRVKTPEESPVNRPEMNDYQATVVKACLKHLVTNIANTGHDDSQNKQLPAPESIVFYKALCAQLSSDTALQERYNEGWLIWNYDFTMNDVVQKTFDAYAKTKEADDLVKDIKGFHKNPEEYADKDNKTILWEHVKKDVLMNIAVIADFYSNRNKTMLHATAAFTQSFMDGIASTSQDEIRNLAPDLSKIWIDTGIAQESRLVDSALRTHRSEYQGPIATAIDAYLTEVATRESARGR